MGDSQMGLMDRTIIVEKRTIEGYTYEVSLEYDGKRKKFVASATPMHTSLNSGSEVMSLSDMTAIKPEYLPIVVPRFSKALVEEAKRGFEKSLQPVLQQCMAQRLKHLTKEDFGREAESPWRMMLKKPFVAYGNLITTPTTFTVDKPDVPLTGWTQGKIDNQDTTLYLQLTWKDETDIPWEWNRYVYLVMRPE